MPTYKKLDPDFKKRWVKALRSGKYSQTKSALRRTIPHPAGWKAIPDPAGWKVIPDPRFCYPIGFCCLGVACDVIDSKAWTTAEIPGWRKHAGGTVKNLPFVTRTVAEKLAQMNDQGMSFSEIADWIDEHL